MHICNIYIRVRIRIFFYLYKKQVIFFKKMTHPFLSPVHAHHII